MLPSRKNNLTIQILSRLKAKGAPAPMVKSFSPIDPVDDGVTDDQSDEYSEQEELQSNDSVKARKKKRGQSLSEDDQEG